uniref:Uncharacterized protein n=1 Tax=Anguilla anguilla TaxID=7936 RepID=A0A0E9VF26_ANGAN
MFLKVIPAVCNATKLLPSLHPARTEHQALQQGHPATVLSLEDLQTAQRVVSSLSFPFMT